MLSATRFYYFQDASVHELTMDVNESEEIRITVEKEAFSFDMYCFSETFQTWIKQDLDKVRKDYPANYLKLEADVEKFIFRKAA